MDINDDIGLLTLNCEVVFESVVFTLYLSPSDLCLQIHRHLCWYRFVGSLIEKWCLRVWSLLHIYLLLNSVHKYTEIYDGIGLWVLNLEVMLERVESTPYLSPSELCSQTHRHL